jgi:hypothetical protein
MIGGWRTREYTTDIDDCGHHDKAGVVGLHVVPLRRSIAKWIFYYSPPPPSGGLCYNKLKNPTKQLPPLIFRTQQLHCYEYYDCAGGMDRVYCPPPCGGLSPLYYFMSAIYYLFAGNILYYYL